MRTRLCQLPCCANIQTEAGCSSAWLERRVWDAEAAGSNPAIPTVNLEAQVTFRFRAESLRTAGAEIRELREAAAGVGFELLGARIEEVSPSEPSTGSGTSYVPLDDPGSDAEG
jgi:hypothetical protein